MKETVDKKKPKLAINLQFEPIDEKPATNTGRNKTGSNTSKVSNGNKSGGNQAINEYLSKANPNQFKNQNGNSNSQSSSTTNSSRPKTQQIKKNLVIGN